MELTNTVHIWATYVMGKLDCMKMPQPLETRRNLLQLLMFQLHNEDTSGRIVGLVLSMGQVLEVSRRCFHTGADARQLDNACWEKLRNVSVCVLVRVGQGLPRLLARPNNRPYRVAFWVIALMLSLKRVLIR